MEAYTTEQLYSFYRKQQPIPTFMMNSIKLLQSQITEERIIEQMNFLKNTHPKYSKMSPDEFKQHTANQLYASTHGLYFIAEIDKRKNRIRSREYYHKNKQQRSQYREDHKTQIKEYAKIHYQINKAKIKEYKETKKTYFQEKFNCECGGKYTRQAKSHHIKTAKHQRYINQ